MRKSSLQHTNYENVSFQESKCWEKAWPDLGLNIKGGNEVRKKVCFWWFFKIFRRDNILDESNSTRRMMLTFHKLLLILQLLFICPASIFKNVPVFPKRTLNKAQTHCDTVWGLGETVRETQTLAPITQEPFRLNVPSSCKTTSVMLESIFVCHFCLQMDRVG